MQTREPREKHEGRQHLQTMSAPADWEIVQAAIRRLLDDPGDADALFAVAAWDEVMGDRLDAMDLLNRLVSRKPDYPGVWWLRARVLKDMGREGDAIASERIARLYAELDFPDSIRKFPL